MYFIGSPGSPLQTSVTKSASALTLHWSEGVEGAGPVTGYVIEARPSGKQQFIVHLLNLLQITLDFSLSVLRLMHYMVL